MKAIIFSDSHRQFNSMVQAIEKELPVDIIIHAGDVQQDVDELEVMYPNIPIICVKGNNDFWSSQAPYDRFFELDGVRIFLTHGHNYGVKYSITKLWKHAKDLDANICIFGHTHKRCHEEIEGLEMFNPGSAYTSYGVLEITADGHSIKIFETQ